MKTATKIRQQEELQYRHSIPVALSKSDSSTYDILFDRKVDLATAGERVSHSKRLRYETSQRMLWSYATILFP
jgi:hypothetical protein